MLSAAVMIGALRVKVKNSVGSNESDNNVLWKNKKNEGHSKIMFYGEKIENECQNCHGNSPHLPSWLAVFTLSQECLPCLHIH